MPHVNAQTDMLRLTGKTGTVTITDVGTFSGSESADTTFINPRIGFLWRGSVLAVGMDAGVQIPLSASTAGLTSS